MGAVRKIKDRDTVLDFLVYWRRSNFKNVPHTQMYLILASHDPSMLLIVPWKAYSERKGEVGQDEQAQSDGGGCLLISAIDWTFLMKEINWKASLKGVTEHRTQNSWEQTP